MAMIEVSEIVFEEHRVPTATEGIELHLRNKRPQGVIKFAPEKTIVMVHGATFSSGSLYDVPLGGFSFMDFLAVASSSSSESASPLS